MLAEARRAARLLGPAAGEHEVQPRVVLAGGEERVGEQVGALLARQAPGVEDVERSPAQGPRRAAAGREARDVDAAVPARRCARASMPSARERRVGGGARREDDVAGAVERAERQLHPERTRVAGAQPGVGGELGVVACRQRQLDHPRR